MADPISDDTARTLRAAWFQFVDAIEPVRPRLHAYCLQLTGVIWDAEDLLQDTLLRGFGAMGRGDLHGAHSRFDRPAAYLCQIATNLWIDRLRRNRWQAALADEAADGGEEPAMVTAAAGRALFERASPQQRAAVVLKDVFDFSLDEIAAILVTTPGAVKSALHRGREKLARAPGAIPPRHAPASPELIDRFIAAFNARDTAAIAGLLLEGARWEVEGVGGERGRDTIWLGVKHPDSALAERRVVDGLEVVVFTLASGGRRFLSALHRIEEDEGRIARIVNYYFCPETLAYVAAQLGLEAWRQPHHQDPETLKRMIAGSVLPWAPA